MRTIRLAVLVSTALVLAACGAEGSSDGSAASHSDQAGAHAGHAALTGTAPDPVPIRLGPQGLHPQFVVKCHHSHTATDDPIVWPGTPGASHLHEFFGSEETDASSTGDSLLGGSTTCENTADTAAYWVPALFDGESRIEPVKLVAYYRTGVGVDPDSVEPWPTGLKMLAGDPGATAAQSTGVVGWTCGTSDNLGVAPRECTPRAPLTLRLTFPDCWDGRNIDSEGHRSHVAYSTNGRCPSAAPRHIVQLILAVNFGWWGEPSNLRLASGHIRTGHGDVLNGWSRDELAHLTRLCLQRGEICGISSNRTDLSN